MARETVIYDQEIEMTPDEYKRFKAAFDAGDKQLATEVDGWINRMDIHDSKPINGSDVEVYVDGEQLYSE